MPLDPQAQAYLDAVAALGAPAGPQTPEEMRAFSSERNRHFAGPPPDIARVEGRTVPGPEGEVPVRIYTPDAPGPLPIFVYYHGGGWVVGNIDMTDNLCRALANQTPCVVVSVEY